MFVKCINTLQRESSFHITAKRRQLSLGKNTTSLRPPLTLKSGRDCISTLQRSIILFSETCAYFTSTFCILTLYLFLNEIILEIQKRSKTFPEVFLTTCTVRGSFLFIAWAQEDIWTMAGEKLDPHLTLENCFRDPGNHKLKLDRGWGTTPGSKSTPCNQKLHIYQNMSYLSFGDVLIFLLNII